MGDYSKYNIVYRLQKWMDSVPGQTFLNYAYSWGASIVIAGTLFTLTHLPGAKLMIFLGMGTEIIVFFLSAFDRPFDKTADGRELPTHVTEEYLETGKVEHQDKNVAASEEMQKVQSSYVDELKNLVDTLGKVNEQSSRLTRDSEEMENLNRTLTGITKVYEMQLKSASQQIGTIDQINEQTRKMAQQIEQLNSIYARMIAAMTANLKEK
jgi:methyl-accepting chemotaxis protein